jgi:hypothetical protein
LSAAKLFDESDIGEQAMKPMKRKRGQSAAAACGIFVLISVSRRSLLSS